MLVIRHWRRDKLTETKIVVESILFIIGGRDTESSTMTNVVDLRSRIGEPKIDEAFPDPMPDDWVAVYQTVKQLPVLNAVVQETVQFKLSSPTGLERVMPAGRRKLAGQ